MTQVQRLHEHLLNGPINPLQSWKILGIYRLSARVFELKVTGVDVKKRNIKIKNKFGDDLTVAEYYL